MKFQQFNVKFMYAFAINLFKLLIKQKVKNRTQITNV